MRAAIERWHPPCRPEVAPFDAAVYALCCAVLAEGVIHAARNIAPVVTHTATRTWEEEATDQENGLGLQVRRPIPNHVLSGRADGAATLRRAGGSLARPPFGEDLAVLQELDVIAWLKTM